VTEEQMRGEIVEAGRRCGLPLNLLGQYCHSARDGDCTWRHCPQERDGEPKRTGRHCPLDLHEEERGYQ
jgi:hypothetical protein